MILVYPVTSMDVESTRRNLLGENPAKSLVDEYSNVRHVTAKTPPTFLVHALDDRGVPIENSLRMYRALRRAGVHVEFAMYEQGGHGFGLVARPSRIAEWPRRCEAWLRRQGVLE